VNFNYFIALIQRLSERDSSFNLTACRDGGIPQKATIKRKKS
jgi:hypothetical protein